MLGEIIVGLACQCLVQKCMSGKKRGEGGGGGFN